MFHTADYTKKVIDHVCFYLALFDHLLCISYIIWHLLHRFLKTLSVLLGQEKDQRSLDLNTAKCMLGLLLGKTWPLFPVFNQFLEVSLHTFSVQHMAVI